jgi:hypothetical protein
MLKSICCFLTLITLFLPNYSVANLITNGDFNANSQQWHTSGNVSINNNIAYIATNQGYTPLNSSVISQGDDGTFSFANAISLTNDINWLIFDVKIDIFEDLLETNTSPFSDLLNINLYNELDPTGTTDLLFSSEQDLILTSHWSTLQLNVSALAGQNIALSFELFDENNHSDSIIQLDNVKFSTSPHSTPVPEPTTFFLLSLVIVVMINPKYKTNTIK